MAPWLGVMGLGLGVVAAAGRKRERHLAQA